MLFKFTAVTAEKCLNVPTNQLLNILSMLLLSHSCCNREEQSERRGFPQQSWPKTCFPPPNPTSFLQFITPQLCRYNSLLLTLFSDGSFQESRLGLSPTVLVAQVRRVGRGVGRGCAAGEQGLVRLGLLLCQGAVQ